MGSIILAGVSPLLRPRWILAHVVVLAVAWSFVSLGLWQLRRLEERDASNARISARLAEPVGDASTAFDTVAGDHRRARIVGTYDTANETILSSRSHRGISGHHVLTPLRTPDGRAVLVNRGWVELTDGTPPVARAAPPPGQVTVIGIILAPPTPGRFAPQDLGDGGVSFRIEPARIAERAGYEIAPLYLQLQDQEPPQPGEFPIAVIPEPLDRGPHLSYALQWFAFALAAVGTYGAFAARAYRAARRRSGSGVDATA